MHGIEPKKSFRSYDHDHVSKIAVENFLTESADPENEKHGYRRIYPLLPFWLQQYVVRAPSFTLELSEDELRQIITERFNRDLITSTRLRLALWKEFHNVTEKHGKTIFIEKVIHGTCSQTAFALLLKKDPIFLAWILCPPQEYEAAMSELLDLATTKMRQALMVTSDDPKTMAVQLKIWDILLSRVHGAVPQFINQRNLNVNVDASKTPTQPSQTLDMIEAQLHEVRKTLKKLEAPPPVQVDVQEMIQPAKIKA